MDTERLGGGRSCVEFSRLRRRARCSGWEFGGFLPSQAAFHAARFIPLVIPPVYCRPLVDGGVWDVYLGAELEANAQRKRAGGICLRAQRDSIVPDFESNLPLQRRLAAVGMPHDRTDAHEAFVAFMLCVRRL